jgi:hypothetical protein
MADPPEMLCIFSHDTAVTMYAAEVIVSNNVPVDDKLMDV